MPIDTRHPREIRADIRRGALSGITAGLGQNFVQANLAVLPRDWAYDFLVFCQRNPRPCPLIEVTDPGSPEPVGVAPGADLRTDIPRYRIYKDGALADEVTDATPYWRDDLVAFLLGCSFTFEWALLEAGGRLWHGGGGGSGGGGCPRAPAARAPRARPSTSAPRPRSGSRTSAGPTGGTRRSSARATCRCSGPAASRRRPWRSPRSRPSCSRTARGTCSSRTCPTPPWRRSERCGSSRRAISPSRWNSARRSASR